MCVCVCGCLKLLDHNKINGKSLSDKLRVKVTSTFYFNLSEFGSLYVYVSGNHSMACHIYEDEQSD